jgi:predicted permease
VSLWSRLFKSQNTDLDDEIQSHLAMAEADKRENGADAKTAVQLARREFGNVALVKEVSHELTSWMWLDRLARDVRFAMRQITRAPGFSLAVILTLALGIGVNTAVFSMVNGFMLRPLPYPDADRIASLILHREGTHLGQSSVDDDDSHTFETWNLISQNVPAVQAAAQGATVGVNLQAGAQPGAAVRYVQATRVSAGYFNVLGIEPLLGRGFTADEDRPDGPKAVVLGYPLWHSAFGGDPHVLGKGITLKGEPYTVVGVLPNGARSPGNGELFVPLAPADPKGECNGDNCGILLRLRNGATWQEAGAQIARLRVPRLEQIAGSDHGRAWFYAQPLSRYLGSQMRTPVLALMLAVSFILFIACANLAGLTLVRIDRRTQEIATRLALGAARSAILRQLWIESLLLALIGATAGLLLARGILASLHSFVPDEFIPLGGLSIDGRVLAFTFLTSLATSLFFGALPAFRTRHVDMRSSAGGHAVAGGSNRIRQVLIAAEVALTVVLLFSSGLLIRTLIHLQTQPPGFDASNVMTAKLSLDEARYRDPAAFRLLLDRSLQAMRRIPGVEDAAVGLSVPYERGLNDGFRILDGPLAGQQPVSSLAWVTPGYFRTLRIPVLAGRPISDSDSFASGRVAVVNKAFGRKFFNDPSPLGRHISSGKDQMTIVGVVGDVAKRPGIDRDAPIGTEPVFYIPAVQADPHLIAIGNLWFQPSWIVRTRGRVPSISAAMQRALAEADPGLPFAGFYAMSDILAESLVYQRIEVALLSALAALALLLSAIGIYGLVSSLVVQRTREIGIRMALGSTVGQAMVKIGVSGVVATAFGLVAGLALSLVAAQVLRSQLYGVRDHDPVTLLIVPVVLAVIALAASLLPTLRITRIQPAEALRME